MTLPFAYIGPGAGFAFLGSFLTLAVSLALSFFSLLTWPIRVLWMQVRRRKSLRRARVKKIIFLGLDGLDPTLTERFMSEGKLPNLTRLKDEGSYRRLRTTFPALSPVAWSTFATGVNPAKHNIFDFLNRDLRSYVPELSSSKVRPPRRRWSRATVERKRKSTPFWNILGEHSVRCTVLRVPITFPPDEFNGLQLSAMAVPDLRGTQGSFSWFTTNAEVLACTGGSRYPLTRVGAVLTGVLEGAAPLQLPFTLTSKQELLIDGQTYQLTPGEYSPWIRLRFHGGFGVSVHGIVRFLLTQTHPDVSLYVTPVQIDPENPALPISHPAYYATYLAKLLGSYATLGMAEDTWALNEGAIDESNFLNQAALIQKEREAMYFSALDRTRRGVVACVFDTTDRVQHMFFRHLEDAPGGQHSTVIENLYKDMDRLVGETLKHVDPGTALFVLSDHGFCSFRRGVNLNAWLHQNGYLALQAGRVEGGDYFEGVDWSRTRAYTLGLGGLYLNVLGREAGGIVTRQEADALKQELIARLTGLPDGDNIAIQNVYATSDLYRGPYLDAAPDFVVGYAAGYRTSWGAAVGKVTAHVFEDNNKAWSGDHCVDPILVPGVLFSNRKIDAADPGIEDLAPTALTLFGVEPPAWMEGHPVFHAT